MNRCSPLAWLTCGKIVVARALLAAGLVLTVAPAVRCGGLAIQLRFVDQGMPFPGGLGNADFPTGSMNSFPVYTGTKPSQDFLNNLLFENVVNAACWWTSAIQDPFVLKLSFGWQNLGTPPGESHRRLQPDQGRRRGAVYRGGHPLQ
jgi:hypothetical protein